MIVTSQVHARIAGMSVLLVTHESSAKHVSPPGHPERPERLDAAIDGVLGAGVDIVRRHALAVDRGLLERVHSSEFIEEIRAFCSRGGGAIDDDTYAVAASYEAAIHAAGAGPAAVDSILAGNYDGAFVAMRPPGHHAEESLAMGFCLFNNVAITATYLTLLGNRVAVVDWDVHHGNGTQNTFLDNPDVLYVSIHQSPFYPGTGLISDTGVGKGRGMTVNIPLPAGTKSTTYLGSFGRVVVPIVEQFSPDWILVSNGYDAHRLDPIGGLMLESADYGVLTGWAASQVTGGRIITMLEGGYDLDAISESSSATTVGLARPVGPDWWPNDMLSATAEVSDRVVETMREFWKFR
ncbi:MAG: histone deacetylase [Acidobacteria bacterium]|nr:MAG: histone deacetylase [Acidobacteriota bacterium]